MELIKLNKDLQAFIEKARTLKKIDECILPKHKQERKKANKPGYVYFVAGGSLIKIGWAVSVVDRVKQLQTGSPCKLFLLGAYSGEIKDETKAHKLMKEHHISGEWFKDDEFNNIWNYAIERSENKFRNFGYVS